MNDATSTRPIDTLVEKLARKGIQANPTSPGKYRSRCPVHQGKSENLSIEETSDGTLLIKCHHRDETGNPTCSIDSIMHSLDLAKRDLFVPLSSRPPKRKATKSATAPRIESTKRVGKSSPEAAISGVVAQLGEPVACWVYHELDDGRPFEVMRVYRFDLANGTKQFRPVHLSHDGWLLGDPPGKLPLYNLRELASARAVIVLEGEKCADLARSLGLTATTSAHGAQSPAKTDWSPLAGKDVALSPDNDESGAGYVQLVARLLWALEPRPTIRILELPLTEKGQDIEEWYRDIVPEQWSTLDCRIELERRWAAAAIWAPPPGETPPAATVREHDDEPLSLTEWGNAMRLVRIYGDRMRYCYPKSKWLTWDGSRWANDEKGEVWRWTKEVIRTLLTEALANEDSHQAEAAIKWALKSHQKKVMGASMDLAWSEPGIGVMPDDFDRDPWLLNTPNGVVDLRTGQIRPANPQDLLLKMTSVPCDSAANCPRWKQTIAEIFAGDTELIGYFQRAMGYSLTGDTREHALFFCYGTGRNGKNTVLDTVKIILGDYATIVDPRLFLAAGQNDHPAAIADLVGRRFVLTSEVDSSQQLAEGLVKRLTGDRTIKARFMNQNPFEFQVQFKVWMLANNKPEIRGQDEGIWSRIRIIPFDTFIPKEKRIKGLSDILIAEEGPGILGWLVAGCRDWVARSLDEPQKVTDAVSDYRAEQDVIGAFLEQCTRSFLEHPQLRDSVRVKASVLYGRYVEWCEQTGERDLLTARKFGSEITRRGFSLRGTNGQQFRCGLELSDCKEEF